MTVSKNAKTSICACGCGLETKRARKFIHNHHGRRPELDRFYEKVERCDCPYDCDCCWLWIGAKSSSGYGNFKRTNGLFYHAHKFVLERSYGSLGELEALHSCDVKLCVRDKHLHPGTQLDNVREMIERGRASRYVLTHPTGEFSPSAKLNNESVLTIRELAAQGIPSKELAHRFDVCVTTINRVVRRAIWNFDNQDVVLNPSSIANFENKPLEIQRAPGQLTLL